MKLKNMKMFEEKTSELNISDVIKHINDLKDEYERIRNYEYDDEFNAVDRKRDIQMIFYTLGIDFDKFDR